MGVNERSAKVRRTAGKGTVLRRGAKFAAGALAVWLAGKGVENHQKNERRYEANRNALGKMLPKSTYKGYYLELMNRFGHTPAEVLAIENKARASENSPVVLTETVARTLHEKSVPQSFYNPRKPMTMKEELDNAAQEAASLRVGYDGPRQERIRKVLEAFRDNPNLTSAAAKIRKDTLGVLQLNQDPRWKYEVNQPYQPEIGHARKGGRRRFPLPPKVIVPREERY